MMKGKVKMVRLAVAAMAVVALISSASADTWRIDERGCAWSCVENPDGTIMITGIDPQATGSVVMPTTLDGIVVTRIKDNAFRNCIQLTGMTIPGSIKHIGSRIIKLQNSSSCFRLIFTSDIGTMEVHENAIDGETEHLEVEVMPKNRRLFVGWFDADGNKVMNPFCSPIRVVVIPNWGGSFENNQLSPKGYQFFKNNQLSPKGYQFFKNNDSNSETYGRSKLSVAVVSSDDNAESGGIGTGFVCEMSGKKYFVTNKHVVNQRDRIQAMFIDGTRITFGLDSPIEVADNRDLVRFAINTELPCLSISPDVPKIGDAIEFYGNAGGGGVVTMTAGKILAVGMERIEIDSPIQGGNSGSPLVLVNSGAVIGVTTISYFNRLGGDPSKVGTRYDPNVKLTREFAVRFLDVKWKSMTYGAFLKAVNVYKDYSKFYAWMEEICLAKNQALVFEYKLPDLQFYGQTRLNNLMKKIARCDEVLKKNVDRLVMMREKNKNNVGRLGCYGDVEIRHQLKRARDGFWASYKIRKEVLTSVLAYAKADSILPKDEKADVVDAFDWMLRSYCEKFRRQLQGHDLGVP